MCEMEQISVLNHSIDAGKKSRITSHCLSIDTFVSIHHMKNLSKYQ